MTGNQRDVRNKKTVPLIPRKTLFGNPDKASVRLSPDGTKISYLAPVKGVLNVWVGPEDNPRAAKPVTHDTRRGIRIYFWAYTNEHVLYLQDKDGDENWRLYSVDLTNGETKDLTPLERVQARVQQVSPDFTRQILVGLNERVEQLHDLYRIDIRTGEKTLIQENEGFVGFVTDDFYRVRLGVRMTPDGGTELLKPSTDKGWELFSKIAMEDSLTTKPLGFDKSARTMYMTDSRDRNTAALMAVDMETGEYSLLAEDQRADASGFIIHPSEKSVQAVAFTYERRHWQVLDESIADDLAYLRTVAEGDVEVTYRTLDDRLWIVAYLMDKGPLRYYCYDHDAKRARFLFTNRKDLEGLPLARMHPVTIKARDGMNLVSYYTLPVDSDSNAEGHPERPLPMVLWVHGGPWGRNSWGHNPYHQWFANRGYAALSVNFRASAGFGKDFLNAGNLEWGAKMHDDLIDAVDWAIQAGIADPDRVAIAGGSYGGYATLVGMTLTPKKFACGVDIVGPSNLVTLLETIPPYWKPQIELFATRVGDHRTEEGRAFLTSRSPLTYAHHICRPLLIGQGANDPRVKQAESDQIVRAMQEKSIPVTYVLYSDEGHGFARPENRLSFTAVAEAFLANHLGGRHEPIKDAFKGSSISIPVGPETIPDLARALREQVP